MNDEAARLYAKRMSTERLGERVSVEVSLATGSHHSIVVFARREDGEYEEGPRDGYASGPRALVLEAGVGDIVYQRTTSPANAEVLERYGVVLGERRTDWGSDADWVVDFGPMGDATRRGLRGPTASAEPRRDGVPGTGSTSGGGSG